MFNKPTTYIMLEKKVKLFPLKAGIRQGCPFSSLLFNVVLGISDRTRKQKKEIKSIRIEKKEVKISLFTHAAIHKRIQGFH